MIVNEGEASPTAYMQQDYVMEIEEDQVTTTKDNDVLLDNINRK